MTGELNALPPVDQGGPDLDRYHVVLSPLGVKVIWFDSDPGRDSFTRLGSCADEATIAKMVMQHHNGRPGGPTEGEPDGLG